MLNPTRIVIIGSGPGGYIAALKGAMLGAQVQVVEKDLLGGVCLNRGCIPTKAIVRSASAFHTAARRGADFGFTVSGSVNPDMAAIADRAAGIAAQLRRGIEQLFKVRKVELVQGFGRIKDAGLVEVDGAEGTRELRADKIIVATGTENLPLPHVPEDGERVIDSTGALQLRELPEHLVVVGAGIIAVEFASIYARLGSQVTMLARTKVLRKEDTRLVRTLTRAMGQAGVRFLEGIEVDHTESGPGGVHLRLDNGDEMHADRVLVAVGRKANTEKIGLENLGVEMEGGYIKVDDRMQTNIPGVYAIGDCIGGRLLAHVASAEGIVAVQNCLGPDARIDYSVVPNCIFTYPEVATVGLTEDQAKKAGHEVRTGRFPFMANGKALADGEPEGFVQIVADGATDRVLGAQIVGLNSSDLIHEIALGMRLGATSRQIGGMIHQHPTLSEAVMEAAEAVSGEAIHVATQTFIYY